MAPVMAFMNPDISKTAGIHEEYVPLCMVLLGKTDEAFKGRDKVIENINFVK